MSFQDHFSAHAGAYAVYRPTYPPQLFSFLAGLVSEPALAWDCATGNGQAAQALGPYFKRVVATDASNRQIANAFRAPRVSFVVSAAEHSGLASGCCNLITVAQALHWLNLDLFYAECQRVLEKTGVLAAWCYNLLHIEPVLDQIINKFYFDILGDFWPAEREYIESGYRSIEFPFVELATPDCHMTASWSLEQLIGYLTTWSATQRYHTCHGENPLKQITADLQAAWGASQTQRIVTWPLTVRVGRIS